MNNTINSEMKKTISNESTRQVTLGKSSLNKLVEETLDNRKSSEHSKRFPNNESAQFAKYSSHNQDLALVTNKSQKNFSLIPNSLEGVGSDFVKSSNDNWQITIGGDRITVDNPHTVDHQSTEPVSMINNTNYAGYHKPKFGARHHKEMSFSQNHLNSSQLSKRDNRARNSAAYTSYDTT